MITRTRTAIAVLTALAGTAALAGCTGPGAAGGAEDGYPQKITNCGREVTLNRAPRRVVALGPSEVTTLVAAGGADRLVARDDAGEKSAAYTGQIRQAVASVPQLGSGGDLSRETLVEKEPDLVVGSVSESISPQSLGAVGIPLLSLRGNCGSDHAPGSSDGTADFADIYHDVSTLGRLLGTSDRAERWVAQAKQQVAAARRSTNLDGRSAAAVIVFENDLEIYGKRSMTHTQLTELGADDVFSDTNQRVFQASLEELVRRDPDSIVLLSYGQSDAQAKQVFLDLPGVRRLRAVRADAVFVQPYEYSSQGVLAVRGLTNMARHLKATS